MKINFIKYSIAILCFGSCIESKSQITFINKNNLLHSETGVLGSNANVRSGNSMAIVDVNNDGLDDIVKFDNNTFIRIEYQQVGGSFLHRDIGSFGSIGPWSMSLADVDHNGYKDILAGGGSQVYLMKLNATGTGMLGSIIALPNGNIFSQNANFMDVNNDGWEDIFVCNDVGESRIWANDGFGNFPAEQYNSIINFDVTPGTSVIPDEYDESGNYGSVWTDFDGDGDVDFYIAHCRQSYGPGDLRRTNVLFENNGDGTYTSNASAHGLASNDQDWTASFGDIDNDGDFDVFMTKHDVVSRYYINNNGIYTLSPNIIAFGSMPMQSQFIDFDNDGFVDLFITGDNDHRLYRNNGNSTFSDVTPSNLNAGGNLLSFASGDLNHDGKIDLYGGYGSTFISPSSTTDDIYWQNSTNNTNHFVTLNLDASVSNESCLGARAYIYGAWGIQTREVRASESYGTLNSFQLHFGLGSNTIIDSLIVKWPSGIRTKLISPSADQFINVLEQNTCTLSGASVSPSGPLTACTGDLITLTASASGTGSGYTYQWSNGATTQSITVSSSGSYAVTAKESIQCQSTSSSVLVTFNPNETPTVSAIGMTEFCQGDSVLLSATSASSYLWSSGETSQTIYAKESGAYSVTTQGLCQQWTSNNINVNVNAAPAPISNDVTIVAGTSTTLSATGNNISWYSASSGGDLLNNGANYTTPIINTDTTFYVEDSYTYGGGVGFGGSKYHIGTSYFASNTSTNAHMVFTANENAILKRVKVYTDIAGIRTIELRNSTGVVLMDTTVNIPSDSSFVDLNFNLIAGNQYQLGTNTAQNNASFGYMSPRLRRTNNGAIVYPFYIKSSTDTLATITGTSQGANSLYYYFYDWEVEKSATICKSERTPVHVFASPVGLKSNYNESSIVIYPNPASDIINVLVNTASEIELEIIDMLGKKVYAENYTSNGTVKSIATSGFCKGAYEITIKAKGTIYHHKLIIQ